MRMRSACVSLSVVVLTGSSLAAAQSYGQQQTYGQPQPSPYTAPGTGAQPGTSGPAPGLQSGGLAPPETTTSDPFAPGAPATGTEQELERAEREDAGRGLEFLWLNAEVGFEHLGLQTFKANDLVDADAVATTQTGPAFGAGLGVRLVFVTLGARFRLGTFDEWQLWTLNGELGIRIPLGAVEPYMTLGGGYASVGSFDTSNVGADLNEANVEITGFNVRGGVGVDVYLSDLFSVGANLTGEVLALTRPGVDPSKLNVSGSGGSQAAEAEVYAADGSSIGSAVTLTAVAGLHF
jgi:hypothetical protein